MGYGTSSARFINCSSSGYIGTRAGGIIGMYSAMGNSSIVVEQCFSTGYIENTAGGIIGAFGSFTNGSILALNCYSTGSISSEAGGIFGKYENFTNTGTPVATNCYSTGNIGTGAGGIFGCSAVVCVANNCYSTGNIAANGGGIFGSNSITSTANNCYICGSGSSNFFGAYATSPTTTNCAATPGGWVKSTAITVLQGIPSPVIGTTWVETTLDAPFELLNTGYTPYTINNVTTSNPPDIVRTYSASVLVGNSTSAAVKNGLSYTILEGDPTISIDSNTGVISTGIGTLPGVYTLYIRNNGSYNITTVILTVTTPPPPPPPPSNKFVGYSFSVKKGNEEENTKLLFIGN